MTLALCLGNAFLHGGDVQAKRASATVSGETSVFASKKLDGATMKTGKTLYIYYNNDIQWRWNINNLGTTKGDCVHLDDKDGKNCTMVLESAGTYYDAPYYAIRYTKSDFYIDSEGDNADDKEVIHQYKDEIKQDNQRFRFVPVEGKC